MSTINTISEIFDKYTQLCKVRAVKKREILIQQDEISNSIYYIKSGILRMWHNADGADITLQFFEKDQFLSSFESFYLQTPGKFTVEVIEDGEVLEISRNDFQKIMEKDDAVQEFLMNYACERFIEYINLFLSRIKNTPEQRYIELLEEYPDIIQKIPHHYIASYLGITPVSLSRIRNRIKQK